MTEKVTEKAVETAAENVELVEEIVETGGANKVVLITAGIVIVGVCGYITYKQISKKKGSKINVETEKVDVEVETEEAE